MVLMKKGFYSNSDSKTGGFTLLETVVALGLFSLVLLFSTHTLVTIIKTNAFSQNRTGALALAQGKLESLKSQPGVGPRRGNGGAGYQWKPAGGLPPRNFHFSGDVSGLCLGDRESHLALGNGVQTAPGGTGHPDCRVRKAAALSCSGARWSRREHLKKTNVEHRTFNIEHRILESI